MDKIRRKLLTDMCKAFAAMAAAPVMPALPSATPDLANAIMRHLVAMMQSRFDLMGISDLAVAASGKLPEWLNSPRTIALKAKIADAAPEQAPAIIAKELARLVEITTNAERQLCADMIRYKSSAQSPTELLKLASNARIPGLPPGNLELQLEAIFKNPTPVDANFITDLLVGEEKGPLAARIREQVDRITGNKSARSDNSTGKKSGAPADSKTSTKIIEPQKHARDRLIDSEFGAQNWTGRSQGRLPAKPDRG